MVKSTTPRSSDYFSADGTVEEGDTNMLQQQTRQRRKAASGSSGPCGFCTAGYDSSEHLEYNYSYVGTSQPLPRCRERGEYYIDSYNDQPWSWTFGTGELVSRRFRYNILRFNHSFCFAMCNVIYLLIFLFHFLLTRTEYGAIHRIKQGQSCLLWSGYLCYILHLQLQP